MFIANRRRDATLPPDLITDATALLRRIERGYSPAAIASSFSLEDMILIDLVFRANLDIGIFMIDTGRLHEETHALIAKVKDHYHVKIHAYFPRAEGVETFVTENGPNPFFDSVSMRQQCCALRKVEPLQRALKGKRAWITGQRREHSVGRNTLQIEETDTANGLHKANPLAEWTTDQVWAYIDVHNVPYNALYDQGFASIGCAPCTRAITAGEDMRAGRWWWEDEANKECGLHVHRASRHVNSSGQSRPPVISNDR